MSLNFFLTVWRRQRRQTNLISPTFGLRSIILLLLFAYIKCVKCYNARLRMYIFRPLLAVIVLKKRNDFIIVNCTHAKHRHDCLFKMGIMGVLVPWQNVRLAICNLCMLISCMWKCFKSNASGAGADMHARETWIARNYAMVNSSTSMVCDGCNGGERVMQRVIRKHLPSRWIAKCIYFICVLYNFVILEQIVRIFYTIVVT